MASQVLKSFICLALALVLSVQGALGAITCDRLNQSTCAFSVSSSGTRCVLEKRMRRGGQEDYACHESGIEAEKLKDFIEIDECIAACGLDRNTMGISSDSLLESRFAQKLCSPECYHGCPNIIDLYFNLAAGEGVFLPKVCEMQQTSSRRGMAEIRSSGVAAGPESGSLDKVACGPTQSEQAIASSPAMPPM